MSATDSLYSLLIKKHKLSKQEFDVDDLPALREKAESTLQIEESSLFLGSCLQKNEVVPVLALDDDLAKPFGWTVIDHSFNVTAECLKAGRDLICVATFNNDYRLSKSGRVFGIRFGFFTHESDVLQSRCLGFDALTIHGDVLDLYEMQYLVEVCRDYRMSCLLVVSNQSSLEIALQTDCPYIAVWACQSAPLLYNSVFASEAVIQFPKVCTPILFAPHLQKVQLSALQKNGYKLIFQP